MIPLWRRLAIAALTLTVAAVLFRGQIGAALVTRGDDALRTGDRTSALRYYRRALSIDGGSATAADRLAFDLEMRREPGDAAAAILIATAALAHSHDDPALLSDRALAEQQLRQLPAAQRDFAAAGERAGDPRYDHFAGRVALARGHLADARRYFELALQRDPHFDPARAALMELAR